MNKRLVAFLISSIAIITVVYAQEAPKNWKNADPETDHVAGMSVDKAYTILQGRTSTTVVVAVEDDGVDVNHPDLKGKIWTNTKEIVGNGIDDDHNGHVDDIYGWNFIGGMIADLDVENLELTRLYRQYKLKYEYADSSKLNGDEKKNFTFYKKLKSEYERKYSSVFMEYSLTNLLNKGFMKWDSIFGKGSYTLDDIKKLNTNDSILTMSAFMMENLSAHGMTVADMQAEMKVDLAEVDAEMNAQYNLNFHGRDSIVGDNPGDLKQINYGNNDIIGPGADHGTHVSGIIGAIRGNNLGTDGIVDNVKIIAIRTSLNGDERDKDVANGIRYAVDNGAKVINMSFGKPYSPEKGDVDDAVKYAADHDVLLVCAAGNDAENLDSVEDYPNKFSLDGSVASNWIEVGSIMKDFNPSTFSNYSKTKVDVFAPGSKIYSTVADSGYATFSGTSMASPCVAGVAALIRSYFPSLTAVQVRDIILKSVDKIKGKVKEPGTGKMVRFSDLCVAGGEVDAYKAVKLAMKTAK